MNCNYTLLRKGYKQNSFTLSSLVASIKQTNELETNFALWEAKWKSNNKAYRT